MDVNNENNEYNVLLQLAYFTPLIMIMIMIAIGLSNGLHESGSLAIFITGVVCVQLALSVIIHIINITRKKRNGGDVLDIFVQDQQCSKVISNTNIHILGKDVPTVLSGITQIFYVLTYTISSMMIQKNINIFICILFILMIFNYIYQFVTAGCFNNDYIKGSAIISGIFTIGTGILVTLMFYSPKSNDDVSLLMFRKTISNYKCNKMSKRNMECKVKKKKN